jgi:MoaD family protein
MILIKVRFYGITYDLVGRREQSFKMEYNSSILDLLKSIKKSYPNMKELIFDEGLEFRDYLSIALNNVNIQGLKGVGTKLNDGDVVFLMPPIGGG